MQAFSAEAASSRHASTVPVQASSPSEARDPAQIPFASSLATAKLPPINTGPKALQPPAPAPVPASSAVRPIPFMTQATTAQLQSPVLDEDIEPSSVEPVSPVEVGNGSPGAASSLLGNNPTATPPQPSGSPGGSPSHAAGKAITPNGKSPKEVGQPEDNSSPGSARTQSDMGHTAEVELPLAASNALGRKQPANQDSLDTTSDVEHTDHPQAATDHIAQSQQPLSARSQQAEAAFPLPATGSPAAGAELLPSQAVTSPLTAAAYTVKQDDNWIQQPSSTNGSDTAAGLQGVASPPEPAAASSSKQHVMQSQGTLPAPSHAQAAAVAEAIKRAAQASEAEQAAAPGVLRKQPVLHLLAKYAALLATLCMCAACIMLYIQLR